MSVVGHVSMMREDGEWSMFQNHIMADHIPAVTHALAGRDDGVIDIMGAGTSSTSPDDVYLEEMTSYNEDSETATYTNVNTHGPVVNLQNSDINIDASDFVDYSGAIFISGTFGEGSHRLLEGQEISEIALFTGDRDYMFARTVVPEAERFIKLRNQAVTISWMIYYGVEETTIIRRDWLGDGYGFMYGQNYGQ